jgi:hypothetical protein
MDDRFCIITDVRRDKGMASIPLPVINRIFCDRVYIDVRLRAIIG